MQNACNMKLAILKYTIPWHQLHSQHWATITTVYFHNCFITAETL